MDLVILFRLILSDHKKNNTNEEIMKNKEFTFAELSIELSEELFIYSVYKKKFEIIALEKANIFHTQFYNKFNSMDDLAENGFQYGLELIKSVIEIAVDKLVEKGMYDVNEAFFTDEFVSKHFTWEDDFNKVLEEYIEVCLTEDEAKSYRDHRKNNRSRWGVLATSGNFGEAVSAQMTTGMWNVAEGIGHSIFNAIGNSVSKATANSEKKRLFYSEKTVSVLVDGIYRNCFNLHFALIDALNANTQNHICSRAELLDAKKVARLLENLIKNRIPSEEINNVIKKIIETYPYELDFFRYLLSNKFNINDVVKLSNSISFDITEVIFGESLHKIKSTISSFDLKKRSKILSTIEQIEEMDAELNNEMVTLKQISLNYFNTQFDTFEELEKAMKTGEQKSIELISIIKYYSSNSSVYVDNIPQNKRSNAFESYNIPYYEKILALIDSTRMGSANEGIAFCSNGIYSKSRQMQKPQNILYHDLNRIKKIEKGLFGVNLVLDNNSKINLDLAGSNVSKSELMEIMESLVNLYLNNKTTKKIELSNNNHHDEQKEQEHEESNISVIKNNGVKKEKKDYRKISHFEMALCMIIPILGGYLFYTWKKNKPEKSKGALISTIIGIVLWTIFINSI